MKMIMFVLIIILTHILGILGTNPIIDLPQGKIRGALVKSPVNQNFSYYIFEGIPFAAPPTGKLRFQPPQQVKNWNGIIDAVDSSISCYQTDREEKFAKEDCLYLSVYSPTVPTNNTNTNPMEVLVFIYGGSFIHGHMDYGYSKIAFLMEENIVVVTFNYRVGPLGFLSTGDEVIAGNMGLKDQQFALKWVQSNIHLFSGDPSKVTIMGQSAGSASVTYHLLSPGSAGLFRAAIACSGSALNSWAHQQNPVKIAYSIAAEINPTFTIKNSTKELLTLLQNADINEITKTSDKYKSFAPVLEVNHNGSFLSDFMYVTAENGKFNKVPILMGFNSEEDLKSVKDKNSWIDFVRKNYDKDVRKLVDYDLFISNDKIKAEVGEEIKEIYVKNDSFQNCADKAVQYKSDNTFIRGIIKFAELISQYVDVYFYQFSYFGKIAGGKVIFDHIGKVGHGDDQKYFWSYFKDYSVFPESDVLTVKRYNKLLVNFIKQMNPTPNYDALFENVLWPKVTRNHFYYLDIDNNLTIKENPRNFSYKKWVDIYEKYGKKPFISF